jgi:hypothetical protein
MPTYLSLTQQRLCAAISVQALFFSAFTHPLNFLWIWVTSCLAIMGWGIAGPHRPGMRTVQTVVAATLGKLARVICLSVPMLTVTWDGLYMGIGASLA